MADDRDYAIATRDRIGRLYGYSGPYGTTNPTKEAELPETVNVEEIQQAEQVNEEEETNMDMIFNRFNRDSVAGRMLSALATGPKTPAQLAHLAGSKSADNILASGGWYFQLRRFGKTSKKFLLAKDGNKLVLTVSKRYANQI